MHYNLENLFLYKIASIAVFISRPVSFVNISCGYAEFWVIFRVYMSRTSYIIRRCLSKGGPGFVCRGGHLPSALDRVALPPHVNFSIHNISDFALADSRYPVQVFAECLRNTNTPALLHGASCRIYKSRITP